MKTIVIIGAGFSGTMCAVHLLKNAKSPLKIVLVDPNKPGRGLAYAENDDSFLLNVRADQMGAFPEDHAHFFKWLETKKILSKPSDFISRKCYGDYIQSLLKEATISESHASLEIIQDKVLDIDEKGRTIIFKNTPPVFADKIILATGLDAKSPPSLEQFRNSSEDLTIIGTGLSMIDVVVYLGKINFKGKMTAVSRHGRLPAVHHFYGAEFARPAYDFSQEHSLLFVLKTIKENLKKYEWRLVIDGLRPYNQFLWSHFSDKEKKQFHRYCRSLWDVHRHRMSPEHKKIIELKISEGSLVIKSIGFKKFVPQTNHVLELTGLSIGTNPENILLKNLLSKNIVQKDILNLGIKSDSFGNVYSNWIYTLGPLRRGQLWECIAVPEVRAQARDLALHLLNSN